MRTLPLQDMIAGVIKTASAKLAAEAPKEPEKVKKLLAYEKHEHGGHLPSVKEEEEECKAEKMAAAKLLDPVEVEKLASAVDYISTHLGDIEAPGPIAAAMSKLGMKPGAGGGTAGGKAVPSPVHPSGLATTEAIGGEQKYTKNKAKGEQAEDEHNKGLSGARAHDGKTQLDNNMHAAPGQNSGAVPHVTYSKKGPFVAGPSGAHDAGKANGAKEKAAGAMQGLGNAAKALGTAHPHAAGALAGGVLGAGVGAAGGAAGAESGHHGAGALKGALAGGALGAGAGAGMAHFKPKLASPQEAAQRHILMKLAGEDVMKAHIDGGGTVSPLAGKGQLRTMKAGEQSPTQGGGAIGGNEAGGAGLVGSNKSAIDYTKRDAKKLVVAPLKAALDQPAFSEKHDNKLQENLRNTGKAGVKIAGVQAELQKIASAGCTCNSKGECQFCTMKAKVANMGGMGGGGMAPMAAGGEASDGCTCGHTGECRVCKLQAAMHAAKGGGHQHAGGSV